MESHREAFRKLGFGAKFDLKRFRNDAVSLKLFNRVPESDDQKIQQQSAQDNWMKAEKNVEDGDEKGENEDEQQNGDAGSSFRLTRELVATEDNGDSNANRRGRKRKKKTLAALRNHQKQEEISRFRKRNKIYIWGTDVPEPCPSFDAMIEKYSIAVDLADTMHQVLAGWAPTPIQMQAVPLMLQGREMLASAPTGSGKTFAFVIPLLHHLRKPQRGGFRAVIVEPTRELVKQVYREIQRLNGKLGLRVHMITNPEVAREKFGPDSKRRFDILISTPNRLIHLLKDDPPWLDLSKVEWLIVDESDKLFEIGNRGFREQLAKIYQCCNGAKCRRAFFSATFSYDVEQWCKTYLDNVVMVTIGARNTAVDTVRQELTFVGSEYGKLVALRNLIREGLMPPVLVFIQTKERAQHLFSEMLHDKHKVDVIHSGRDRKDREKAVKRFRKGDIMILICTELMGRGIDFRNVSVVINYDFPPSAISYIHRIGRTGRAGRSGRAITFFTEQDRPLLRSIANVMREAGCPVPEYMLELKKPSRRSQEILIRRCADRPNVTILRNSQSVRKRKSGTSHSVKGSIKKRKTSETTFAPSES